MTSLASIPGIEFTALEIASLWVVQPSRETTIGDFAGAVFGDDTGHGRLLIGTGQRLLRPWPHQAYLHGDQASLPAAAGPFAALLTDIADAYCAFRLDGNAAFDFAGLYLSAELAAIHTDHGCLRCRLGHYTVILWWQDRNGLQLLLERSLARSFADYLGLLMTRHRPGPDGTPAMA